MSGEREEPSLTADEKFMQNLDSAKPEDYPRDSDEIPTDLLFEWIKATVQPRQKGAKKIKERLLKLLEPDAAYYSQQLAREVTPEDIFSSLHFALDEEYSNFEIRDEPQERRKT